eukprot:GFYU01074207.1.p1 GENE.GFYU01074207.1~~GFYU01074207.1.p1  ORF type:complete len:196 (+),score=50.38 GFYU01074207.1:1-588(+)
MKQIRTVPWVIMLVDRWFFESMNCMRELSYLMEDPHYADRLSLVRLPGLPMYEQDVAVPFVEYWAKRQKAIQSDLDMRMTDSERMELEHEMAKCQSYMTAVPDFLSETRGIKLKKTTPLEQLICSNFEPIVHTMARKLCDIGEDTEHDGGPPADAVAAEPHAAASDNASDTTTLDDSAGETVDVVHVKLNVSSSE